MRSIEKIKSNISGYYRKYYRYQVIVGLLLSSTILLSTLLFFSFTEYYTRLSSRFRLILLSIFVLGAIGLLFWKVVLPFLKLLRIQKGLSEEEMAQHIGHYFSGSVDDQLLNLLQLQKESNNNALAQAAIEQKANKIQDFDFKQAISKNDILQWLKILCIPFGFVLLTILWNPDVIREGSGRILSFNQEFARPNPYLFEILNDDLVATDNESFLLEVTFQGDIIPSSVFISKNGKSYRMTQKGNNFEYNFGILEESENFQLEMGEFQSQIYTVEVKHLPSIFNWQGVVTPPAYTQKEKSTVQNQPNIICPEGASIDLSAQAFHCENLSLIVQGGRTDTIQNIIDKPGVFKTNKKHKKIKLVAQQKTSSLNDVLEIDLVITPDEYPDISVKQLSDSTLPSLHFFSGACHDDYGIQKVEFVAELKDSTLKLPVTANGSQFDQHFHFSVDFSEVSENSFQYYFVVWDNDAVNGSKNSKTSVQYYSALNKSQKDSLRQSSNKALEQRMQAALDKAKNQKESLKKIQETLKEKDEMSWQDKQQINDYLNEQKALEEEIKELQKLKEKQNLQNEKYQKKKEALEEKQKAIDKLFEELLDEETKKMMEELEKLMEKLSDKQTIQEQLNQMEMSNEQMEQQLDRTLELFKQLEVEQILEENIEEMEKLAEEQMRLSEEKNSEESQNNQEELNKAFEELQKKMDEMRNKNEDLQNPKPLENTSEEEKSIQEKMKQASDEMKQGKNKKSNESQKDAGQQMKSLSAQMQQMQQSMQQQQQSENIQTLRQILENLIFLSLEQEKLLEKFKRINRFDPKYPELTQEQKKLNNDAQIIEDSLNALAKRQPMIAQMVHDELRNMKENMSTALSELGERQSFQAVVNQQRVMQSANTLALLLDEALQQMQNQMMQQQFGQNSCNKPGGNPKPGQSMQQLKQMLSKQLEQMKKMMEEGGKVKGKEGKNGENGKGQSKEFAKMAAQQAAMKEKLKQLQKELQKQGGGLGDQHSLEKDLEEIEEKLYNKEINSELIERQERILTRMLEAEESMNEREFEEKRSSESGKNDKKRNLLNYDTYQTVDDDGAELLETAPQHFKLYYRTKVSKYFNNFD